MCQYVLNIEHRCDIGHKTNYSIGFHNRYAIMYIHTHYMGMIYCARRSALPSLRYVRPFRFVRLPYHACTHSLCLGICVKLCQMHECLQFNANNLDAIEVSFVIIARRIYHGTNSIINRPTKKLSIWWRVFFSLHSTTLEVDVFRESNT